MSIAKTFSFQHTFYPDLSVSVEEDLFFIEFVLPNGTVEMICDEDTLKGYTKVFEDALANIPPVS